MPGDPPRLKMQQDTAGIYAFGTAHETPSNAARGTEYGINR